MTLKTPNYNAHPPSLYPLPLDHLSDEHYQSYASPVVNNSIAV